MRTTDYLFLGLFISSIILSLLFYSSIKELEKLNNQQIKKPLKGRIEIQDEREQTLEFKQLKPELEIEYL